MVTSPISKGAPGRWEALRSEAEGARMRPGLLPADGVWWRTPAQRQHTKGEDRERPHVQRPRRPLLKQQQFWGFWGAHGLGNMGLAATTWVPMGAEVPLLSPNDHPNPSQGLHTGFGKVEFSNTFVVPNFAIPNQ